MKAIILAAGYATRLFPLTKDFPKPLIPIAGKPMIDYIIKNIEEIGINEIFVVTNNKFANAFEEWVQKKQRNSKIEIINDETMSNDDRLGAIGDIQFVIKKKKIEEDLLIIGGDNMIKFSLKEAYELFKQKRKSVVIGYDVKDKEKAKSYAVLEIDDNKKVLEFVEKPQNPKSTFCGICVYFYPKEVLKLIDQYLEEGNIPDAPGNLPAWLITKDEVYAKTHDEKWYDVGGFESLKEAKEDYGEENVDIEELKKGNI